MTLWGEFSTFEIILLSGFLLLIAVIWIAVWRTYRKKEKIIPIEPYGNDLTPVKHKKGTPKELKQLSANIKPELKIEDTPIKEYNPLKKLKMVQRIKNWYNEKFHPDRLVLINMELLNGFHITFLTKEKYGGFKYNNGKYVLDNELKYFNLTTKYYQYDYHESFALPVRRKIPLDRIRKTLESSKLTHVIDATNPATLEQFVESEVAKQVMRGARIDDFLRQLRLITIITGILCLIHLLLFMQKSGMLSQITGALPF